MGVFVFFLRVSTQKQTIESQYDEMLSFATTYYNISESDIVKIEYKESGRTLSEEERAGISDFKKMCEEGVIIEATFISELSRIARKASIILSFTDYLCEHGIQLICKNPRFELLDENKIKTATASLTLGVFSALAEQELIEKKYRFARGKERKAKEGKWSGGAIPFGYKVDSEQDNKIVPDEDGDAKIVREVFDLYERGFSQARIAKEFHQRGYKRMKISLVHQLLTNKLLTGAPNKNRYSSYERTYPAIISKEQFERCRKIANENITKSPMTKYIHYVDGLIKCPVCGKNFVSTGCRAAYHCSDAHNYYKQFDGYEGQTRCSNRLNISSNVVDSIAWYLAQRCEILFLENQSQEQMHLYEEKLSVLKNKIENVDIRFRELKEKEDRIAETFIEGLISKERKDSKLNDIKKQRRDIQNELLTFKEEYKRIEELLSELKSKCDVLDIDSSIKNHVRISENVESITDDSERRELIHKHIKRITIKDTTIFYMLFKAHPNGKTTRAKEITIDVNIDSLQRVYYYLPFCGKGVGVILEKNYSSYEEYKHRQEQIARITGETDISSRLEKYEPYELCNIEIQQRIVNKSKEVIKKRKKEEREKLFEQMHIKGYISVKEMRRISGQSQNSILYAINNGIIKRGVKKYGQWWIEESAFGQYLIEQSIVDDLRKDGYVSIKEMMDISGFRFDKIRYAIVSGKLKTALKEGNKWWAKKEEFLNYVSSRS